MCAYRVINVKAEFEYISDCFFTVLNNNMYCTYFYIIQNFDSF